MIAPAKPIRINITPAAGRKYKPDGLHRVLLASVVALVVARPLIPSEGVSWLGDGQPFNLLWLLLAAVYFFGALKRGYLERRIGVDDLAMGMLVVIAAASAAVSTQYASPRLAINMLWEWIALGVLFFLVRQLVQTPREARAMIAVMLTLAVVLSSYGFYQVLIGLPADRVAYAENPDQLLQSLGQWSEPGSPERMHFESRLHSTEPLATFALTNSLAGFLATWLIVGAGLIWSVIAPRRTENFVAARIWGNGRTMAWALALMAIGGCLLLTKSRSALVATLIGGTILALGFRLQRRWNWKLWAAAAGMLAILVGGALAIKGLDREMLTEIPKSFGYRLQYWMATIEMISDHPLLGVGPGNFQDYYTSYKLPSASEEVRDPHNFLLEIWATCGTFAVMALGVLLIGCTVRTLLALRSKDDGSQADTNPQRTTATPTARDVAPVARDGAAGGAAGFLLAVVVGPLVGLPFSLERLGGGLLVGGAVMALLWPWIERGRLPRGLPTLAALVLAIDLLASGGIAFPGVAGSFWLLIALAFNIADETLLQDQAERAPTSRARWVAALGLIATSMAIVACYFSAYSPVLRCNALMTLASETSPQNHNERQRVLFEAAAADPFSEEPWHALAELELARVQANPSASEARNLFVAASARMLELRPHSSSAWRQVGQWYWRLFSDRHDPHDGSAAVGCYGRAVELYPHLAVLRGEFALALEATGDSEGAVREAQRALELDELTPHADKKLSPKLKRQLEVLTAQPR